MNRAKIALAASALACLGWGILTPTWAGEEAGEIKMTAKKYEFNPGTISVKKGERARLVITALDREHGFKLEAFHIDQKLPKGEPVSIEFTPEQAGTFRFECSHFCGFGHRRMKGELVVE